ncbi:NUDIX hydrolase domain-like protein [Russula earlei]|uniref:NUDIX hydrolase domain-like protein n=1 Tax=Russula earlei TaxID=71964 RepID=A0ACC0UHV6_9AGAM|nr:NUDIX hydrolase domain-like protein [Russula earlei]
MSEGHVNFLGGSPLNRLSWLRTSSAFLNTLLASTSTRWIAFQYGKPLIASRARENQLAWLTTAEVEHFLGPKPHFGQGPTEGATAAVDAPIIEAARFRGAPIVFLGVNEPQANEYNPAIPPEEFAKTLVGTPFFSVDVSDVSQSELDRLVQTSLAGTDDFTLSFAEPRSAIRGLDDPNAAIFAVARSMIDWNFRNKFCASCGSPVYSVWGGWKLTCTSLLSTSDNTGRNPCPTLKGLHNIAHPRTDAVVIMAVLNEAQDKILLGRNKKFPTRFYSTMAGFIEPGESFEDAVKRELWEEAGIHVRNVKYHSGQPWPFPANLMVGFYAIGDPSEAIRIDLDNELEGSHPNVVRAYLLRFSLFLDAKWYTREEVLAVLQHKEGTNFTRSDFKQMASIDERVNVKASGDPLGGDAAVHGNQTQEAPALVTHHDNEPPFRIPPRTAIAGVLISDWALGKTVVGYKGRM